MTKDERRQGCKALASRSSLDHFLKGKGGTYMGKATFALLAYIALIIFWSVKVKRNMGEGMLLGFLVVCLFGGADFFSYLLTGFVGAIQNEVLFASFAFVLMSYLIKEFHILDGILLIFDALLGRLNGGPAFVNIGLSALLGMLSGSNSANTATSGSFTAQWMLDKGWRKELAAAFIAGNGGLGAGFPPSASMFIMLSFAEINSLITESQLYIGLFVSGIYQVIYRVFLVLYLMKKEDIRGTVAPPEKGVFWKTIRGNWVNLLVFLGAIIPILVMTGPIKEWLLSKSMATALDSMSLLIWIPSMMIGIVLLLSRKQLVSGKLDFPKLRAGLFKQYKSIGGVLVFAFAASEIFNKLGLAEELVTIFQQLSLPKALMVLLVGCLVVLVAGPLSSTATLSSIGLVAFSALISVGVPALPATVAILVFASTEGASPPSSGSIFIASGLTGSPPEATFIPLIKYFVVPITILGWMIGMGFLPLFS